MNDQSIKPDTPKAIAQLLFIAAAIGAGIAIAYLLLSSFIVPRIGFPGDLNRILKLDQRIAIAQANASDAKRIAIVSNSVGVEGIEADYIQKQLPPGYATENQSSNGLDLLSGRLYIGRLLQSNPNTLVWILRPEVMGKISPINPELASAMRFGNFQINADWINPNPNPDPNPNPNPNHQPYLDQATRDRFNTTDIKNQASLRTIPLRHLNEQVRTRTRRGILPAKPLELNAPYQIDANLTGPKLQRHLDDMVFILQSRTENDNRDGIAFIEATLLQILQTSTTPILVIAPTHPGNDEIFGPMETLFAQQLQHIAGLHNITLINLTKTLTAQEFADAIHPNRNGAKKLSTLLGQKLKNHLPETNRENN
ncbi:MAG: hypothetical protein JKY43_06390 [Phycisphaerales bacterium]|nr:hypothetical protein [Phycisphaerales bacterium]